MIEIPFIGSSRTHRSLAAANQRCINWYPEIVKDDQGKAAFKMLVGSPGKTLLANISASPLRGLHISSAKYAKYWAVFGNSFYEFIPGNPQGTFIGNLTSNTGPVFMDDNGTHILIVDGTNSGYVYNIASGAPAGWTPDLHAVAVDFIGGDYVKFCAGYFFVIQPGTNIIEACVAPYGTAPTTWDATNSIQTALQDAGPLIALAAVGDVLWGIGDYSSVPFQNTSNATGFPFSVISGGAITVGTASREAVKELNGSIYFPGKTKKGAGQIIKLSGFNPQNVADNTISNAIGQWATVADSYADVYSEEGHYFYCLTSPTGNRTLVYDESNNEWHERSSFGLGRDRAKGHIFFQGSHIVGDSLNGNLYTSSLDVYTENGNPLIATRRSQHLKSGRDPLEIPGLVVDMEVGVGLQGIVNGSQPVLNLIYSWDGGRNWSSQISASIGKIGETTTQVRFPRLGTAEDWVFEISISDPVHRNILGVFVER